MSLFQPFNFISSRVASFWYGFTLPIQSARLILARKSLLAWSLLPLLITLIIYVFIVHSLNAETSTLLQKITANSGWQPDGWGMWFTEIFISIAIFIIAAFTFSFVSTLVASPFNDFLAEKTERHTTPFLPPVPSPSLRAQTRLILIDLVKTTLAGIMGLFALVLSWIPILNLIAFIAAFLLVCFQYISYPQTRREIGFVRGAGFLFEHFFACVGFGMVTTLTFTIPFFSIFALPLAVVGGTLLFARAPGRSDLPLLK